MKGKWTESPALDILRFLGELLALNVLCFLCCLPVITIVASFSAMYSVLFKMKNESDIPVIRSFLVCFKNNFLPSLAVEAVAAVMLFLAYGDAVYALSVDGTQKFVFLTVAGIIVINVMILLTFGIGQIAHFKNSVKNYIKNSFILAFIAPGWMILIWIVWIAWLGLLVIFPLDDMLTYLGWLYFLWGLSLPAYICAKIYGIVFKRFQ